MALVLKILQKDDIAWDALLTRGGYGTIFHSMKFLNYHGNKFKDQEVFVGWFKGNEIQYGLSYLVNSNGQFKTARSPYGSSYGGFFGIVHPTFRLSEELIDSLLNHLKNSGINIFFLTPTQPFLSNKEISETFDFTLTYKGFKRVEENITSIVKLSSSLENTVSKRVLRSLKVANAAGVKILFDDSIENFWPILQENMNYLGVKSTHSMNEWSWLMDNCNKEIQCHCAYIDGSPVAGIGTIRLNENSEQLFYIASLLDYRKTQALSLLIYKFMERANIAGIKFVDFGTSTLSAQPNSSLFEFKESFGCNGFLKKSYCFEF